MPSLQIIYASTSGHTEYVVQECVKAWKEEASDTSVSVKRAEECSADDVLQGDVLVLATSSWNTGGIEGQLNPHMFSLLMDRAKDIDLKGKKVAVIGLGDHRYFYTCKAADHLMEFVTSHGGMLIKPELRIINEPYGQEQAVQFWALFLVEQLQGASSAA